MYFIFTLILYVSAYDPLQNLDQLVVYFVSANQEHLLVTTERNQFEYNNTVQYQVMISTENF
jgi:hypothetical protein